MKRKSIHPVSCGVENEIFREPLAWNESQVNNSRSLALVATGTVHSTPFSSFPPFWTSTIEAWSLVGGKKRHPAEITRENRYGHSFEKRGRERKKKNTLWAEICQWHLKMDETAPFRFKQFQTVVVSFRNLLKFSSRLYETETHSVCYRRRKRGQWALSQGAQRSRRPFLRRIMMTGLKSSAKRGCDHIMRWALTRLLSPKVRRGKKKFLYIASYMEILITDYCQRHLAGFIANLPFCKM